MTTSFPPPGPPGGPGTTSPSGPNAQGTGGGPGWSTPPAGGSPGPAVGQPAAGPSWGQPAWGQPSGGPSWGQPSGSPGRWSQPGPGAAAAPVGGWVAGLVLVAIGCFLLIGRWIPDAGQYLVLAIGLILLIIFLATGEYGFLVPGGIVTGIGAGIPLATAYEGQFGGGLFLVAMGIGFVLIWVLAEVFRLRERNPWPLVPGLVLGTIGALVASGDRAYPLADAIGTAWPLILVVAGLVLLAGSVRRRSA